MNIRNEVLIIRQSIRVRAILTMIMGVVMVMAASMSMYTFQMDKEDSLLSFYMFASLVTSMYFTMNLIVLIMKWRRNRRSIA